MSKIIGESRHGNRFDREFEDEFEDWCVSRAHGEFSKEGSAHPEIKCEIGDSVVKVKNRSVMPFDTYASVKNNEGEITVTGIDDFDTDGTKLTLEGSRETIHIGPQAQLRLDFPDGMPSQHERSELRDREIERSEELSDSWAF